MKILAQKRKDCNSTANFPLETMGKKDVGLIIGNYPPAAIIIIIYTGNANTIRLVSATRIAYLDKIAFADVSTILNFNGPAGLPTICLIALP